MKKFLVIVLSFIIMLVSFSCTNNDKSAVNNHKNQQPQLEQESSNVSEDVIILNMAGRDVKAKLYDNKAALS